MKLQSKNKTLDLSQCQVMGILNVTPDSFSDGGKFARPEQAIAQAERMQDEGATIIDIGGESTRPGAAEVELQQELDRTIPVIEAIRAHTDVWISIDTSKAVVMTEAVNAGADLINDVRALQEPGALQAASEANVPVCLMHMQGAPRTMQANPQYQDIISDINAFFKQRLAACESAGITRANIVLDPGFGFGKTLDHNFELLQRLAAFREWQLPLLTGLSRKSMFGQLLDCEVEQRLAGSLAGAMLCAQHGANIVRVHDVKETAEVLKVLHKAASFS